MQVIRRTAAVLLGLTCLLSLYGPAGSRDRGQHSSTPLRQALVGAWRLAAIDYRGPNGETVDPFYQAGSTGIIIYDASGWMSVQIGAPNRGFLQAPLLRVPAAGGDAGPKADAFDTYYSYYGTWDYDAATQVVTHHLRSSLIPGESGVDYAQSVAFEAGRLIFTVRSGAADRLTVRRKIWERLAAGTISGAAR